MSSIFLERTKQLLRERPKHITLALISEETSDISEVKITTDWLESLLYRNIDPGIIKFEILYNYLSDTPFSFNALEASASDVPEHSQ